MTRTAECYSTAVSPAAVQSPAKSTPSVRSAQWPDDRCNMICWLGNTMLPGWVGRSRLVRKVNVYPIPPLLPILTSALQFEGSANARPGPVPQNAGPPMSQEEEVTAVLKSVREHRPVPLALPAPCATYSQWSVWKGRLTLRGIFAGRGDVA